MNDSISFSGGRGSSSPGTPRTRLSWFATTSTGARRPTWTRSRSFRGRTRPPRLLRAVGRRRWGLPAAVQRSVRQPVRANPNVKAIGGNGNFVEALWFQLDDPVMKDLKVRQALAYAVDRDAVISGVIGLNNPNAKTNNCGLWIPGQGPWCADPGSFAQYAYDPAKADELLTSAGYDCTAVADGGFCTKGGKDLVITISTTAGNVRRATTVSLLQRRRSPRASTCRSTPTCRPICSPTSPPRVTSRSRSTRRVRSSTRRSPVRSAATRSRRRRTGMAAATGTTGATRTRTS